MWMAHWADYLFPELEFYKYGVRPQTMEGLKGIILMPVIHSKKELEHILNNSLPTFILMSALIYYYRVIALKVFVLAWLFTGIGLLAFASESFAYHIGMSGVIYALAGFLFTSGVLRKYRPLQGISLFVAFVYGSMVWGIFPMQTHVSWQGHLSGLLTGVILAFLFRKHGPQAPKYQYEIEKELGIEPPDLEGEWNEKMRLIEEERLRREQEWVQINYEYKPNRKPEGDNDPK
jgi:membrane associated rhomboid family serine protease